MRQKLALLICAVILHTGSQAAYGQECANPIDAIGVSRVATIDTSGGGSYGTFKKQGTGELLEEGEFILTFDDGPHPQLTRKILKTLEEHCTKATFFAVGQMARAHASTLKAVSDAGHTVGAHTWRHPNLSRTPFVKGVKDIERGFAALALATQGKVAPFFRFPRLRESKKIKSYLAERDIAVFSVDVISGDTEYFNSKVIERHTLRYMRQKKKGILLFHDLKKATARALPNILRAMKKRGYKIVHVVPKSEIDVDEFMASNREIIDKSREKWDDTILVASASQLDAYFGPTFTKRRSYKRKKKRVRKVRRYRDPEWLPFGF